jgi:hypothetical protein
MDLIVRKTKETQEKLSNHGLAFYTSGQLFLEEYYTLGRYSDTFVFSSFSIGADIHCSYHW